MRRLPEQTLLDQVDQTLPSYLSREGGTWFSGKHRVLRVMCSRCGKSSIKHVSNLRRGLGLGCTCQRSRKYDSDPRAEVLGERYDAMVQRCRPGTAMARNYGDRGVRVRFESREHFIRWVLEHLPHETYRGVQFDRVDNRGHYEPGNLRLVSARENLANRRLRSVQYMGQTVALAHLWHVVRDREPTMTFAESTFRNWLTQGRSVEETVEAGKMCVGRRDGRGRTTSLTPDPVIVSQYTVK